MRIPVQTVLEFLLAGDSEEDILHQYPILEPEDLAACKRFALALNANHKLVSVYVDKTERMK